jgi:hypothetical protein
MGLGFWGALLRATDGITSTVDSFLEEDFFPDISSLYIDDLADANANASANANMNLNANANTNLNMNTNPPTAPYAICYYLFQFLLQFLVLVFGIDVICLSVLDVICLSILLVTRFNSTNVLDEGLRIGGIGRRISSKVKSVKQGVYRK